MATKRTPVHREIRRQFTPEILDVFRRLRDAEYFSNAWWLEHGTLHRQLGCKLWQWPCVEPPGVERNYVVQPEALALWAELEQAAWESEE
jgi:hypothetical protein